MSAIEFVVRGDTGVVERGAVGGGMGQNVVLGSGQQVSLNLQRSHVLSFTRQGQALEITLVDGQVVTIQGFFSPDGLAENDLYISSSGQLAEVELIPADGNLLLAQYVDADSFGKWSPDDDLYFVQAAELPIGGVEAASEAGMLGVPLLGALGGLGSLLPAAAVAGGALLLRDPGGDAEEKGGGEKTGGGGGSVTPDDGPSRPDDVPDPVDPVGPAGPGEPLTVSFTSGTTGNGHVITMEDYSDGVEIYGVGTANASGTITLGSVTKDITVNGDGVWFATFDQSEVAEGEYVQDVSVTLVNASGSATANDSITVDTFTTVSLDASTVEGDGTVNFDEESDGVVLTGTVQEGSTVVVSYNGNSYEATVTGTSWSLSLDAGVFAQGEYDANITVTATDVHGNVATTSDTLEIDTQTQVVVNTSIAGGDGIVNDAEHASGVTLNGTAEAFAQVEVTLGNGETSTVQANGSGVWTTTFTSNQIPRGELDLDVSVTSTDLAGNTNTTSGTVQIDTQIGVTVDTSGAGGDGTVNMIERAAGVTLVGTSDAGAEVRVAFESGVRVVDADANGNWSADFSAGEIRSGNVETMAPVYVTATDDAGNVASTSGYVDLDTYVNRLENVGVVEGDDNVNNLEASDGITLRGVVEQGSEVRVSFRGTTRDADVNSDGSWSVDFTAAEVPSGTYDATVNIVATDAAGNVASITDTFHVDTEAPDAPNAEGFFRGEEGTEIIATAVPDEGAPTPGQPSNYTFHEYVEGGAVASEVDATTMMTFNGRTSYGFDDGHAVPDGSHVIITDEDDVGNSNSTLMVLDSNSGNMVDITAGALSGFNIGAIDLEFADAAELSLTEADLVAMSSNDNVLIIHGDGEDKVTVDADLSAAGSRVIDNKSYDVYDVGTGDAQLIIGSDIDLNPNNNVI